MKKFILYAIVILSVVAFPFCNRRTGPPRILVFSKTSGYRHASIPYGKTAIQKLGKENGFLVDTTEDASYFNEDSLKNYSAVVFLCTTGDVLNYRQEAAFERFIQAGGGYMGIHSATDTEYDWGWYGRLVGGYFYDHPGIHDTFPNVQQGVFNVVDQSNIATKHLPKQWKRTDEFYSFKKLDSNTHVLMTIDENSYHGGKRMGYHPMAWYHDYDGGRAFYTELGHTEESYSDSLYLKHVLGGIEYAIGDNKKLNYAKAKTQMPPDEDRFVKTTLVQGEFFEPTEMTILPNFDIIVIQRRGEILVYKNETHELKKAGLLNVYWKTNTPGVNAEEGLLGIAKDPNFSKNHYVYIFYSPADTSVNRLSRFEFKNDSLDLNSEKIVLQFYSQRNICCHTGGSVAFGPDGLLYVSTGDNSTPFDEPNQQFVNHGFAPLNDEPGHIQYDARRTAGNSNDLRGKIIRIRVKDDGSYEIPDGNLYPPGTEKTRPEIYVQGDRNPYRISVDQKTGYLYWGEVGPDAGADSFATRGPRGYDEVNQARKAGYFGWPLFVGNNYPYVQYNYATGVSGEKFDPQHPVNDSRNNTGIRELPPAQPAFIWYPYGPSHDFPEVGTGGRNAMAGPVFYSDMYPKETSLPEYYNGKLFIYDWIRGWMMAVTMTPNGDFDKMEPFMEHTKMSNCIDMEMGPDGKLYTLEYGTGWFQKNPDAGLSRIDYISGNRAPKITDLHVDNTTGALPFTIDATVEAADPEKDQISYLWTLGDGNTKETTEPELNYTYTKTGDFVITVEAKDSQGASNTSKPLSVYAGNTTPDVQIEIKGNKTFYFPGTPVSYAVKISDKEDSQIDPDHIYISADYIEGANIAAAPRGHQQAEAVISGRSIMLSMDCKSCHKETEKSIGPAFIDVAKKYKGDRSAFSYLQEKIIKGGGGVWGETQMAAHPSIAQSDLQAIVRWILSLADDKDKAKSLPQEGTVPPTMNKPEKENGVLTISASYTDDGGENIKPLTGRNMATLRNSNFSFTGNEELKGYTTASFNGMNLLIIPNNDGWFKLEDIDLAGIKSMQINAGWQKAPEFGYSFEIHLDDANGTLLGTGELAPPFASAMSKDQPFGAGSATITITPVTDGKFHNIYIVSKPKNEKEAAQAAVRSVKFLK